MEMSPEIREQMRTFAMGRGLNESQTNEMVELMEVFGRASGITPPQVAELLGVSYQSFTAMLAMLGVSLETGFKNDPDPTMGIDGLCQSVFAIGLSTGMMLEGKQRNG